MSSRVISEKKYSSGYLIAEKYHTSKARNVSRVVNCVALGMAVAGHLDCVKYATPLTSEYWVNAVKGGCYGPEQTPDQVGPSRFTAFTAGIEGLFLVGAGTSGGGIMPCVASGVLAGRKAASILGLK
jgi:phytoene dehydrogenase-like protein